MNVFIVWFPREIDIIFPVKSKIQDNLKEELG